MGSSRFSLAATSFADRLNVGLTRGDPARRGAGAAPRQRDGIDRMDASTLVVGLDGSEAGARVLDFAKRQARAMGGARIVICYVIEWSPFSFQTAEENEQRHRRREQEIDVARERVLDPALSDLRGDGVEVEGIVRHGDVADILDRLAEERGAAQIIIGRVGSRGLAERVFGGVSGRLVAGADVPVTIVP